MAMIGKKKEKAGGNNKMRDYEQPKGVRSLSGAMSHEEEEKEAGHLSNVQSSEFFDDPSLLSDHFKQKLHTKGLASKGGEHSGGIGFNKTTNLARKSILSNNHGSSS